MHPILYKKKYNYYIYAHYVLFLSHQRHLGADDISCGDASVHHTPRQYRCPGDDGCRRRQGALLWGHEGCGNIHLQVARESLQSSKIGVLISLYVIIQLLKATTLYSSSDLLPSPKQCYLLTYAFSLAINQGTPPFSVSGHLLHFSPGISHLLCFLFGVSLPGVSWPSTSPLPWGVPCDSLMGDCFWWFHKFMSYSPPFFSSLFRFLWVVAWSFSRVQCWVPCLSTSGIQYSAQAFVDEGLYSLQCLLCSSPCLRSIEHKLP